MSEVPHKLSSLQSILQGMQKVVVAFSGGVDSTFLLKVAVDCLGKENVFALTATSPTYPLYEFEESKRLAQEMKVEQIIVDSNELEIAGFAENDTMRCYHCKNELFDICRKEATHRGFTYILDGSNTDDLTDHRPGRQAAQEIGVRSPLLEAGFSKNEIRLASRDLGLSTWNKQPFACLSSRFPYGTKITPERLTQVDQCESFLREKGVVNYRVRFHDTVARLEVAPNEISRFLDLDFRTQVIAAFKSAGFTYVALDLEGYRTGSMNEVTP